MRALIASCALVLSSFGVVLADDYIFLSRITKIETKDGKTTIAGKTGKMKVENMDGRSKISGTGESKEFSLSVAKDVKVAKAKFNRDEKKFEADGAIEGGLENEIFTNVNSEKPVFGYIATEKNTVTEILVSPTPASLPLR